MLCKNCETNIDTLSCETCGMDLFNKVIQKANEDQRKIIEKSNNLK